MQNAVRVKRWEVGYFLFEQSVYFLKISHRKEDIRTYLFYQESFRYLLRLSINKWMSLQYFMAAFNNTSIIWIISLKFILLNITTKPFSCLIIWKAYALHFRSSLDNNYGERPVYIDMYDVINLWFFFQYTGRWNY